MSKLLVVEGSNIGRGVFKEILDANKEFEYVLTGTYKEAKQELSKTRYEFAVVDNNLKDAPNGEIIALLNKHNIAPIVYIQELDEDTFETFEGAQIAEYIIKQQHHNAHQAMQRLQRLKENKKTTILIVNDSHIYNIYLKQNLSLHKFKVISANNNEEAQEKLKLHPEIALMIVDDSKPYVNALSLIEETRLSKTSKEMKILVLAEDANSYETAKYLLRGADDYIVKQFSRSEFYTRIYQNII